MSTNASAGCIESQDIEEHRQALQPWELILRQMSPGRFLGRLEYAQVQGILFYREHWNRRVLSTGAIPAGYVLFGGPSSPRTQIDWCGGQLLPQRLAFGRSCSEVDFVIPEESDHVALLLPEDLLLQYLGEKSAPALMRDRHHLQCARGLGTGLVALLHRLLDKFLARNELAADERVCEAVKSQLLETLAEVISSSAGANNGGITARQRRSAFHRAIDHAEGLQLPITVPALAAAAGVSQRVLELAFRETLGTTPLRYLRWNRMNQVQQHLLTAEADSTLVKDAALHWGFDQLGRFSVDYKRLFGESPSTTLARHPRPCGMRLVDVLHERSGP